jgi:hypothetical protein
MKNKSNAAGNSPLAIRTSCTFALSLILLATSLPTGAVSKKIESGYGDPGISLTLSTPSAVGAIPSNSTAYVNVNAINVFAVLQNSNSNPDWTNLQRVLVDWWILKYDFAQQRWVPAYHTNNSGARGNDYVFTLGGARSPLSFPAKHFNVAPGYFYAVYMRVSWVNPNNTRQIAAAEYFFDKASDLQCIAGTSNCYSYTALDEDSPSRTVQALYFSY